MKRNTILLLWALVLIFSQCSKNEQESEAAQVEAQESTMENPQHNTSEPFSYLALGDSYTIGEGVSEEMRWPKQLAEKLREYNYKVEEVSIIAKTGWTTRNLLDGIEANEPGRHELVSLLIGVNNQYQKLPFELYETEFVALLDIAIDLAGGKENVFVVSIPDYGVTPFGSGDPEGIGKEIDRYNNYAKKMCEELEIPFIDITGISRDLGDAPGSLAPDRLHPSGSQYAKWTEDIFPPVLDLIKKARR